jgi:GNAT superfamily N-acetyltransferase
MTKFTVREATTDDIPEILEQRKRMYQDMGHREPEAGGAVLLSPWPSHTYDGECRRATILNVYTYPEFRRRGIARQLMGTMIDWCRDQGLAVVYLHASPDGRPLYEALGFEPTAEMRFKLR